VTAELGEWQQVSWLCSNWLGRRAFR